MKKTILFLVSSVAALGCGNNTSTTDMAAQHDMAMSGGGGDMAMAQADMAMTPTAPTLGAQIDRMGRGAINVALTNPFDLAEPNGNRNATRDKYNQDSNPAMWIANWSPQLQINLAVYDGADTKCGNQALACGMVTGCPMGYTPAAGQTYKALGDLLADDRLYLDTTKTKCGTLYLAREIAAGGLETMDCGGRTPTKEEDVVDFMYTAATVGAAPIAQGMYPVNDGVMDSDGIKVSLTTFPFLDDPN